MTEQHTDVQEAAPVCPKCGGAMWDNRASKRNPRAPDFKCRDKSCDGVIWPPRDAAPAGAPAGEARGGDGAADATRPAPAGTADDPACPVCGGKMWDDRTSKRNPRAPDFKCRNKPKVMGGPGCEGVIWPPRDGEPRRTAAAPAGGRPSAAARPPAAPRKLEEPPKYDAPPPSDKDYPGWEDDDLPF